VQGSDVRGAENAGLENPGPSYSIQGLDLERWKTRVSSLVLCRSILRMCVHNFL